MRICAFAVAWTLILSVATAHAQIRITEWEYNGAGSSTAGEFVELMNIGNAAIDMTGWSFDDASATAGSFSIGTFGVVQPKEIVIIAETTEADFRAKWFKLPASVKVIGGSDQNLSRGDGMHIFDNANVLIDYLLYDDQANPGTIRTNGISGNPISPAALGAHNPALWKLSAVGDEFGSYASTDGNIGNPGVLVPEPAAMLLQLAGLAGLFARRPNR